MLKDAAYRLRKSLRSFELVYRLGGEEFLVVLPGLTLAEGAELAERVRAAIEDSHPGGMPVTASLGVASARGTKVEFNQLFRAADTALYLAKGNGRNQVVVQGAELDQLSNGASRTALPASRRSGDRPAAAAF